MLKALDTAGSRELQSQLASHPQNPVPDGAVCGTVVTPDGLTLRYARWSSKKVTGKGTVIICQGRAECIEKYFETVADLRLRGFEVVAFDWRGQGRSDRILTDRKKGYVEDFSNYVIDFDTIVSQVALPDCKAPFSVFAHSMGGLIALMAAPAAVNRISRMVLVNPLLGLKNLPVSKSVMQSFFGAFCFFGLGEIYAQGNSRKSRHLDFKNNRLTTDESRFLRNRAILESAPDLALGAPTIAWVYAACKAIDSVWTPEFMARVRIPILFVASSGDRIVSTEHTQKYGARLRSGAPLLIAGSEHELFQESDIFREQLLAAFEAFVPGTGEA